MRTAGPRWLLVCLLLLGMVGMHHFVPASAHDAMSTATSIATQEPMPAPSHEPTAPSHELMHLCMAVVCAFLGLLLIALLLLIVLRRENLPVPSLRLSASRIDRPPGLSGRALLASVCVLRL
jgi:hypothetical protein